MCLKLSCCVSLTNPGTECCAEIESGADLKLCKVNRAVCDAVNRTVDQTEVVPELALLVMLM